MKVEHTPLNETVSSVFTYSCLLDSRSHLPITSFRTREQLYDLSGQPIPRQIARKDFLPFFALEDNVKTIRSDGAYDYVKLSGAEQRRYRGNNPQKTEEGVLHPPDTWTQGGNFQPYAYSLVLAGDFNEEINTTIDSWIKKAIIGEVYKPEPSSRWEITGGIIPDGIAEHINVPSDVQDYLSASQERKNGHIVWALGAPQSLGMETYHEGSYHGPVIDTLAGTLEDSTLSSLSSMWMYPEVKQHEYSGYMENNIGVAYGIRLDFRSIHAEYLHNKQGSHVIFDSRFKGWYDPLYEISVGTPRS